MHVGLAIFLVAIIGFAIFSHGFRVFLLWLAAAVVAVIVIVSFAHQVNVEQEQKKARIEVEKWEQQRQQQLNTERREIEVIAPQVCPNQSTQKECMEQTENACPLVSMSARKSCMVTAAEWCPDQQSTRKQCIDDTLRAKKEEEARRAQEKAQQAQEEARRAQEQNDKYDWNIVDRIGKFAVASRDYSGFRIYAGHVFDIYLAPAPHDNGFLFDLWRADIAGFLLCYEIFGQQPNNRLRNSDWRFRVFLPDRSLGRECGINEQFPIRYAREYGYPNP